MTWQAVSAQKNFPAFAEAWDRLNAELYASHPMFDSRFVGTLLEHFGNGDELLCIHLNHDNVDGALIIRPLGFGRWALFLPSQAQAGSVMLKNAKLLETLLPFLPGYAWSLDLLSIDPLYSPDWTQLGLPRIVMPHANTMAIGTKGSFANYWQSRPKKLRDNIRRYQRRAEQVAGAISVHCFTQPNEIAEALKRYGELESAGWKGKEGTAIAPDNAQGRFYADMFGRFAATGQAMVMELYAGERLVASRLFIGHSTMWIALKTTYDEAQSAFAPGRLLLHAVIERAFNEIPDGSIEFYTNATHDQADWATSLRPIPHHQILRNEPIATALVTSKSLPHRLAKNQNRNAFDPLQIHSFPNVSSLPPSALELFEQAETRYPEFAAGWFDNLHRSVFAEAPGVRYYVAERAGKAVAILPVRLARYGLVRRIEALGNFYTSLYSPILGDDATEVELAALLETASRDHEAAHEMRFAPMDPEGPVYAATLAALRSIGWIPFRYFCFGNWYLHVSGSWKDYFQQREGQLRNTIKRKGKKFAAAGGTLEIITEPTQAEAAIADFIHVYSRSWKKPEPYPEFIPGLIRWLAAKGWLRLGIARLGNKPIAAEIWIVSHGKACIYKLAHDRDYSNYAPGTLLTARLLQNAIDQDHVTEVDYLVGDDPYKKDWMSERRERWGIVAYNPCKSMGFLLLVGAVIRRFASRLLQHQPTFSNHNKNRFLKNNAYAARRHQ